jgi:hypothetical protein
MKKSLGINKFIPAFSIIILKLISSIMIVLFQAIYQKAFKINCGYGGTVDTLP